MLITSKTPAASRTVRVTAPWIVLPAHASPMRGPWLTRPRVGLSPTSPHSLAGMRMEPPPSLACATATMPAATAAADPPDDPPVERLGSHGLRAGGKLIASVVTVVPSSGTLVRPSATKPAARNCAARYEIGLRGGIQPRHVGHAANATRASPTARGPDSGRPVRPGARRRAG